MSDDHDALITLKAAYEGHIKVCEDNGERNSAEHQALFNSIKSIRNWIFAVLTAAVAGAASSLWDKVFP